MTWNLVKGELRHLDRAGLVGLLKDLHTLAPENRAFLAARFGLEPFRFRWKHSRRFAGSFGIRGPARSQRAGRSDRG